MTAARKPMSLRSVPDLEPDDTYGHVDFFDGSETYRLSIGVAYGPVSEHVEDVLVSQDGRLLRHPYGSGRRMASEEERAAVGWTW